MTTHRSSLSAYRGVCVFLALVMGTCLLAAGAFAAKKDAPVTPAQIARGKKLCAGADKLLAQGKSAEALQKYKEVLAFLPQSPRAKKGVQQCQTGLGQSGAAPGKAAAKGETANDAAPSGSKMPLALAAVGVVVVGLVVGKRFRKRVPVPGSQSAPVAPAQAPEAPAAGATLAATAAVALKQAPAAAATSRREAIPAAAPTPPPATILPAAGKPVAPAPVSESPLIAATSLPPAAANPAAAAVSSLAAVPPEPAPAPFPPEEVSAAPSLDAAVPAESSAGDIPVPFAVTPAPDQVTTPALPIVPFGNAAEGAPSAAPETPAPAVPEQTPSMPFDFSSLEEKSSEAAAPTAIPFGLADAETPENAAMPFGLVEEEAPAQSGPFGAATEAKTAPGLPEETLVETANPFALAAEEAASAPAPLGAVEEETPVGAAIPFGMEAEEEPVAGLVPFGLAAEEEEIPAIFIAPAATRTEAPPAPGTALVDPEPARRRAQEWWEASAHATDNCAVCSGFLSRGQGYHLDAAEMLQSESYRDFASQTDILFGMEEKEAREAAAARIKEHAGAWHLCEACFRQYFGA